MATRPRSLSMGDLMGTRGHHMAESLQVMYSRRLGSIMVHAAESSRECVLCLVISRLFLQLKGQDEWLTTYLSSIMIINLFVDV